MLAEPHGEMKRQTTVPNALAQSVATPLFQLDATLIELKALEV